MVKALQKDDLLMDIALNVVRNIANSVAEDLLARMTKRATGKVTGQRLRIEVGVLFIKGILAHKGDRSLRWAHHILTQF